jgi:hypothetical protein
MKYVIVDGRVTPCRAADPNHCRYHVGATHYASKHDATVELEREIRNDVPAKNGLRKNDVVEEETVRSCIKTGKHLVDLAAGRVTKW